MLCPGTTAAFHSSTTLWPGVYKLQVAVADAQGHSCPDDQPFTVSVCTCVEDTEDCSARTARQAAPSSELSTTAIGLLLLGLCLLLRESSLCSYLSEKNISKLNLIDDCDLAIYCQ